MTDALSILALWALLAIGLALSAALRASGRLSPESSRKFLHVGMGLPLLFLPLLFQSTAPVWILLAGAGLAFAAVRFRKADLGRGLYAVGRESFGEFAYLLGVGLLWTFSQGKPDLYVPPLLVLMFADAAAALIGSRYGKRRYNTTGGQKSWEGSLAFFLVTFLLVFGSLRGLSPQSAPHDVLTSVTIALLVMLMEGASWQGWDNLFVPLAVQVMLLIYTKISSSELAIRLGVALGLFALLQLWKRITLLQQGGALGAVLAGYFAYAFGGPLWLAPPLLFFCIYALSTSGDVKPERQTHGIFAVLAVSAAPLFWAVLYWRNPAPAAFWAAQAAYVVQCACTLIARPRFHRQRWAVFSILCSWSLVGILPAISVFSALPALLLLLGSGVSAFLFRAWQVEHPRPGSDAQRWGRHALLGSGISLSVWLLLRVGPLSA